jgi:hypothetical protein
MEEGREERMEGGRGLLPQSRSLASQPYSWTGLHQQRPFHACSSLLCIVLPVARAPVTHSTLLASAPLCTGVRTYPEFHKKKGIGGSPFKELLQAALLLWEFVIDLADVHSFEVGVAVAWA